MNKKWIVIVLMAFLLSGCGTKQVDSDANIREVSSKAVPMDCWKITRWCEAEGDFKESGVVYEDKVMEFKDAVVEEMLRNMIGKPEGDVYISDLQEIHLIYMNDDGYDAVYLSNLQQPANGYLRPLSDGLWEIKQMETLEDWSPLASLQNLKYLDFFMTSIGDTCTSEEIIEAFPKLEALYFLVWD